MFAFFYQVCLIIFIIQGITIPFLLLASGLLWWKHNQQIQSLQKQLTSDHKKNIEEKRLFDAIVDRLPKLAPLNCSQCGAGVVLRESDTLCPYCKSRGLLPAEYTKAVSLRSQVRDMIKSATQHWRAANILTLPSVSFLFSVLIFVEPLVLLPTVLIGSNRFPNTLIDQTFDFLGETTTFIVMGIAFLGLFIWMTVFILLQNLVKGLRRKLPAVPAFEPATRMSQSSVCERCGGSIVYNAGDLACLCDYCNVVNFRVRFTRREGVHTQVKITDARSLLFGALQIIEEYVGTFFFILMILVVGAGVLAAYYMLRQLP